jgi:type III pantothenate kinase
VIVLDVGNSSVKWATWKNGVLDGGEQFYYRDEGFSRSASRAFEGLAAPRVLAVANVAGPGVEHEISEWAGKVWGTTPCYIRASYQAAGVTNAYRDSGALGVDRWAAIVAAHQDTENPVCVIDCGTAITVDVVDAGGRHQGGLIAPGLAMMRRSLVQETAAIGPLPDRVNGLPSPLSGNTIEGVNSGIMYMASALIDRVIGEATAGYGRNLEAVITGGDAEILLPLLRHTPRYDRHLVLKGIALIVREMLCGT